MLSDRDIFESINKHYIEIEPRHTDNIGPASYDVHLAKKVRIPQRTKLGEPMLIDPSQPNPGAFIEKELPEYDSDLPKVYLYPGDTFLGATLETIGLNSRSLAADIAGCSGLARWFLLVHTTAGFVDPGWGKDKPRPLTLEIANVGPFAVRMWAGMRIGQIRFWRTETIVNCMYNERLTSEYKDATGPQESHYYIGANKS